MRDLLKYAKNYLHIARHVDDSWLKSDNLGVTDFSWDFRFYERTQCQVINSETVVLTL